MVQTIYEKNLHEFAQRLRSGKLDKLDETRIQNFIKRYPNKKWTREQVIKDCLTNEKLCAKMAKDATKQNLDEKNVINKIGAQKLSAGGKNNIRFRKSDGLLIVGAKADKGLTLTKSADFILKYKGDIIYGAQKTIHGSGGAQDNQINDALDFVRFGNIQHKAIAVVDGLKKGIDESRVYTSDDVVKKMKKGEPLV